ncbi:MAG: hypothetical protein KJZ86_14470 [Caldilineaceae bacterium]|nr:hypothetical protein [Caldilineaceae bacterium]HRJ40859.1 hypothetical protein [Caldilineaceae bacterium]
MIVKLKNSLPQYPDLSSFHWYVVIGIEADDLRILNDQGKPYLYPQSLFDLVDANEPTDWVTDFGDEGERYAYPAEINSPGFFEDFFDAQSDAVATFWRVINQRLSVAALA